MAPELGFSSALAIVSRIICTPHHSILFCHGSQWLLATRIDLSFYILQRKVGKAGHRNRFRSLRTGLRTQPCQRSRGLQQQTSRRLTVGGGYRQGG